MDLHWGLCLRRKFDSTRTNILWLGESSMGRVLGWRKGKGLAFWYTTEDVIKEHEKMSPTVDESILISNLKGRSKGFRTLEEFKKEELWRENFTTRNV